MIINGKVYFLFNMNSDKLYIMNERQYKIMQCNGRELESGSEKGSRSGEIN